MKSKTITRVALALGIIFVFSTSAFAGNPYAKNAGEIYRKLPDAKKGGTLYLQVLGNPKVLTPLLMTEAEWDEVMPLIYSPFFQQDEETNEYFPFMAEKLDVSKDRKTLIFTLRKEAAWEDGTPVTSDDVEFSYNAMMNIKNETAVKRAYFEGIKFEKVDTQTFKFLVEHPNVNTVDFINYDFKIIQKKQFANVADFNKDKGNLQPVGNGPYKFKSFSRDQKVEFERNPNWWGYKIPENKNRFNFDTIIFRVIADPALAYEKLIKGDIDVLVVNSETYGNKIRIADKDKFGSDSNTDKALWADHLMTKGTAQWAYAGWNNARPMFASKKTRQALAHLVNYDEIINKVYYAQGIRCVTPFGSLTPNSAPDQKSKAFDYNMAKGLQMLKDDGWSDMDHNNTLSKMIDGKKVKFEFTLRYNSENPLRAKMAQIIKESFKKAGITVNVQALEFNAMVDLMQNHDFDAVIMSWAHGMVHADSRQIWHSSSADHKGSNFVSYKNPEVDKLIDQADAELSGAKHDKINQKIGAMIYDDQPYAFLVEIPGYMAAFQTRKVKSKKWALKYDFTPNIPLYSTP